MSKKKAKKKAKGKETPYPAHDKHAPKDEGEKHDKHAPKTVEETESDEDEE